MSIVYKISPAPSYKFSVKQVWENLLSAIDQVSQFDLEQELATLGLPYQPYAPAFDPRRNIMENGDPLIQTNTLQMDKPYLRIHLEIGETENSDARVVYHAFLRLLLKRIHSDDMDVNVVVEVK